MLSLLLACQSSSIQLSKDLEDSGILTVEPATDVEETTPSIAPGSVSLDCGQAPPVEGKANCQLTVRDADGNSFWEGAAGVGVHGRSSSNFPKPQWAISLEDEAGQEAEANLFGMGKESDWLLNGMWIDRALMRNRFAYEHFREQADQWAPESAYVEVTYNGEYYGLFALVERVDRSSGRVPIPADDGSGQSFVLKADEAGIPSTLQYASWNVEYPKDPTEEQLSGIRDRLQTVERLVRAGDSDQWAQIDLDSAVAFVLIEELVKNNDGYYLSHHLWSEPGGRIHFTPWDLDLSLGQPSYNDNENPESWIGYRTELISGMAETPEFRARMLEMWAEWRAGMFTDEAVDQWIEETVTILGGTVERNFERWPMEDVDFGGTLYPVDNYPEEIGKIKEFLHRRMAWMDTELKDY